MAHSNGKLHINIFCPRCGAEMIELDFEKEEYEHGYIWTSYRKCPQCGAKVEWRR
jgi:endogenous inhibitor of DNA gyrase (YacG/DUF329 family)